MKRTQTKPVAIKSTVKNHSHLARVNKRASAKPPIPRIPLAPHFSGHPQSKQAQLIALLSSSSGASMTHMMELTNWQPHTVRGMLSGSLRKRLGLTVQWQIEDGVRVYRIVEGAQ